MTKAPLPGPEIQPPTVSGVDGPHRAVHQPLPGDIAGLLEAPLGPPSRPVGPVGRQPSGGGIFDGSLGEVPMSRLTAAATNNVPPSEDGPRAKDGATPTAPTDTDVRDPGSKGQTGRAGPQHVVYGAMQADGNDDAGSP